MRANLVVSLDEARRIALSEYRRGELDGIALAFTLIEDEERSVWGPARQRVVRIIALLSALRTAALMLDLRANRAGALAFLSEQSAALAAEGVALRNLLAAAAGDGLIEALDDQPLLALISSALDAAAAAIASGSSAPLHAAFDNPDWLARAQQALASAGPGPGPRPGSERLHTIWLREQVRQLADKHPEWSAAQIALHLRNRLQAALRSDGALPDTQAAALKTLQGKSARQTVQRLLRGLRR